jgi:hypothetical protein
MVVADAADRLQTPTLGHPRIKINDTNQVAWKRCWSSLVTALDVAI